MGGGDYSLVPLLGVVMVVVGDLAGRVDWCGVAWRGAGLLGAAAGLGGNIHNSVAFASTSASQRNNMARDPSCRCANHIRCNIIE